ncbi:MAG: TrkA C-terminal domain-containing protein [Candidatus Izemoplasmatales bacterium]
MNLNQLLLLGIVTFLIYFIFIEIFTVLFRLTGMSKNKSRFQVISLFTNSGYTTQEAELIVNHQMRRRLATTTMLLGYALNVTVISVLINIIMTLGSSSSTKDVWMFLIYFGGFILLVYLLAKVKIFDNFIQKMIRAVAISLMYKRNENIIEVIDHYSDFTIAEISIKKLPEQCRGIPLKENGMKSNYGLQVLAIKRKSLVLDEVDGDTIINEDDIIIVSGKLAKMKELFISLADES